MNTLLRKEIRLVFPAWITAMVLAIAPVWLLPADSLTLYLSRSTMLPFCLFALGIIVLAIAPFGKEFSAGTFSVLLAQPVSRRRIWLTKAGVVASAMALVLISWAFSLLLRLTGSNVLDSSIWITGGVLAIAFFAGGLWTTLLFRQVAAAFWFTLLAPVGIITILGALYAGVDEPIGQWIIPCALVAYSIAGFLWARRLFLNAQDITWTGGVLSLPKHRRAEAVVGTVRRRSLWRSLICKEFKAHQTAFYAGALLLLLHGVIIAIRTLQYDSTHHGETTNVVYQYFWMLWLALPLLIGSSTVAEERRMGTWQFQLCLPVTRFKQLGIKFLIMLVLGVLAGGVLPVLLEGAGKLLGSPNALVYNVSGRNSFWPAIGDLCTISAWIVVVSFYISTLARHTLQAISAALVFGGALTALGISAWAWEDSITDSAYFIVRSHLIIWVALPIVIVALLWLAVKNSGYVQPGWKPAGLNFLVIAICCFAAVPVSLGIYNRVWETFMTLEPPHGPAQLAGPVRPRILEANQRLFVLLPDGRLWTPKSYERRFAYRNSHRLYNGWPLTERESAWDFYMSIPVGGTFLGSGHWSEVVSIKYREVYGIRSDGSLWKVYDAYQDKINAAILQPQRIGSDSDWKAITTCYDVGIALKTNGTIWAWWELEGVNKYRMEPVQINPESDWTAVYGGSRFEYFGMKGDGSVWRVNLERGSGLNPPSFTDNRPIPNLNASDWVQFTSLQGVGLILRRDGSLWAYLGDPRTVFDQRYSQKRGLDTLFRIGSASNWNAISDQYAIAGIQGQELRVQRVSSLRTAPWWIKSVWNPSRHSDWIALLPYGPEACLALAADGTLSLYGYPAGPPAGIAGLLEPSRKPLWSVNVLAEAK